MKRALFCFMVISFFLCLGGYGQATQFMDHVSLTVVSVEIDEGFTYNEELMESLVGKKLNLFTVIYNDASMVSHGWDNDTGEELETFGLDYYMTFLSDGRYELGDDFLSLLDVFNFDQPSHPYVRQVYDDNISVPGEISITYDYVFRPLKSGFTFGYTPSIDWATGMVFIKDAQGRTAAIGFGPPNDVQRAIIKSGVLIGDDVLLEEEVVINRDSTVGNNVSIGSGTIVNQGVVIGDDVVVGSDVTIDKDTTIGKGVVIGTGTFIGKGCNIEDDVVIGERVMIGRDVTILAGTIIPDDTVIGKGLTVPPLP